MNDEPTPAINLGVRKRDGKVEPFSRPKLLRCLTRCLHETSDPDPPATAEAIAEAVARQLELDRPATTVLSVRMREIIESVLSQTGYGPASEALRHHFRFREQLRRQVSVAYFHRRRNRYVNRRWSKSAVVDALQREHNLGLPTARLLGGTVETAILRCGLRVVTTGMIEQTIVSELLAWGLVPSALTVSRPGRSSGPAAHQPRGAGRPD
jgi:hypothetical protein